MVKSGHVLPQENGMICLPFGRGLSTEAKGTKQSPKI